MATNLQIARELNRGLILEQHPSLDPSIGSVVDSLLVDGAATLTVKNADNLRLVSQRQRLGLIAAGDVQASDSEMDELAAFYATTRYEAQSAGGRARVVVRDNRLYTVPAGSTFTVGSLVFSIDRALTVYSTIDPTAPENAPRLQQVYDDETGFLYQFELDLVSSSTDPSAALVSGDRLAWLDGPSGLGYVEAVSNFSAGRTRETNPQLATRLLQGVTAQVITGRDNAQAVLRRAIPNSDLSLIGVNSPMMTRDRANPLGISTGGRIDVYVKLGGVARKGLVVDATVVDPVARTVDIALTREQAAGLYRAEIFANNTDTPPDVVSGLLQTIGYARQVWTDVDAFNPLVVEQVDMAYSARSTITYTVQDTRETAGGPVVDMSGGAGSVISGAYRIEISYQPQLIAVDGLLTSAAVRPAGVDVLVKAAVPAEVTVGMTVTRPIDYNGPDALALAAGMAAEINRLPVSTRQLDVFTLSNLLNNVENSLTLVNVSMSATVRGQNGLNIPVNAINGVLSLPLNLDAKVAPDNTYFTTSQTGVVVNLV